jgi:serine/threonine-protein kinase
MPERTTCPDCGAALPAGSTRGLCPRCLLRAGLADPSDSGRNGGPAASVTSLSVLNSIAATVGSVPRVLLRDTAPGEEPGPIIRPQADGADGSIRYRIDGEIARGGMGTILKGRDPDLGRDVALKVLREDLRENADMVRRFVEEAQIGGQLQHPGVVPIYELGTFPDRRPFFAMKLVKGRTLARLLEARAQPGDDLPRLLSIFEAVCQTVAYAHARGVIHRDLKPSNVMAGSFGEVQVMDWGLAKVLPRGGVADDAQAGKLAHQETVIATARSGSGEPGLSHAGSVLGTPPYMSPEQARGEVEAVDERADVFALGSILCELLTGEPAFTGRSSPEIIRKASHGDLADALSRLDRCRADAELVGLARDCLASKPEDRPRHAGVVAERVTAHLAGVQERVRAAERELAVAEARAVEERRRRKVQLALAASVLALTTLGGLSATYYLEQRSARAAGLERGSREALTLRAVAEQEPEKVERWEAVAAAWRQAEAALGPGSDPRAAEMVAAYLREAQERVDAARRDRALLEAAAEVRANKYDLGLAEADAAYARAFGEAGLDLLTLPSAEAGVKLRTRPAAVAVAAAAALDDWALIRREDRPKDDRWRRPLEAARAADPDPFRDGVRATLLERGDTAREAVLRTLASDPSAAELPTPSAVLLAASLKDHAAAVALLRAAADRHPDDAWVNHALAARLDELRPAPREEQVRYYSMARAARPESAHDLAHLLDAMGRPGEALAVFADLSARRPGNARHLTCYGQCLQAHVRPEAADVLGRAVAAARAAIRLEPDDALAHNSLGNALAGQGKLEAAVAEYRAAIRLKPDYAGAHYNLGLALAGQGKPEAAVAEYREAIRLKPDYADGHHNLGFALARRGEAEAAIAEYREAIRLKPDDAKAHYNLGLSLAGQGKPEAAIAEYRAAIRLKPGYASAHINLGAILCDLKRDYSSAEAEFREAIRLKPDDAMAHNNLGNALAGQGKPAAAVAEYRAAIRLKPDAAEAHKSLGDALAGQGKPAAAVAEYRAAIRLKPDAAEAHKSLGDALAGQGKPAAAVAEYREAIRLRPDYTGAHENLGNALSDQGEPEAAIAAYRETIRLRPDYAEAHYNLGNALAGQGKVIEAIAEYREAIRLKPDYAEAHCNLGMRLGQRGDFEEALKVLRRGHELGSRRPDWPYPSAMWVQRAERRAALSRRLEGILKGDDRPRDNAERLALPTVCYETKRYATAAKLWAEALEADRKLGEDRQARHRYNAACAAALAASGAGKDEPPLDATARAKLRSQALGWLRAERDAWAKLLEVGPPQARAAIAQMLRQWKMDTRLSAIRDSAALAKLPEAERKEWQDLWADVDRLLKRAGAP